MRAQELHSSEPSLGEGVNRMAGKKVSPKAPAASKAKGTSKAAATRVTKKKVAKKVAKRV
jgi:hypothetical protein